jgi:hypothetical protein
MRRLYRERYGDSPAKKRIDSLFWKESLLVTHFIREHEVDLPDLLARNDRLRFLLPSRHPMDCALSNPTTGHSKCFSASAVSSPEAILDRVIEEIAWFLDLQAEHPDRFFCFYESDFDEKVLRELAAFLHIEPESGWIRDALESYQLKSSYDHPPPLVEQYRRSLADRLRDHPEARAKLAALAPSAS